MLIYRILSWVIQHIFIMVSNSLRIVAINSNESFLGTELTSFYIIMKVVIGSNMLII